MHIRVARGRTFRSIIEMGVEGEGMPPFRVSIQHGDDVVRRYLDVGTYRPTGNLQQRGE